MRIKVAQYLEMHGEWKESFWKLGILNETAEGWVMYMAGIHYLMQKFIYLTLCILGT